jgi:hypothetical protein
MGNGQWAMGNGSIDAFTIATFVLQPPQPLQPPPPLQPLQPPKSLHLVVTIEILSRSRRSTDIMSLKIQISHNYLKPAI